MARNIEALISKNALLHNLNVVRKLVGQKKIIAIVKANAYGHGLVRVAKTLQDVDYLAITCIEEALSIRAVGIKTDLILMEGFFCDDELPLIQKNNLQIIVHNWYQVQALQAFLLNNQNPIRIWIKINTGMNRLGFQEQEFQEAYNMLKKMSQIEIVGFITHFACADEIENAMTQIQIDRFIRIVGDKKGLKSTANSAGILAFPQSHFDVVRPGIMLYGASPFADKLGRDHQLLPVMELSSRVHALQILKAGEKVGYGGSWQNPHPEGRIAMVACGYGDGYPWQAKNGAPVLVNGEMAQTCGRISMDMLAVDVTHLPQTQIGDKVTLWGGALPIELVAKSAGTIPYELMCSYIERVPARLVD